MSKQAPTLMEIDAAEVPEPELVVPQPEPIAPAPEPGDPDYDWAPHYDTDDLYTHTFTDGKVVTIKTMVAIYSKTWLYKVGKMKSEAEVEFRSLDRACCQAAKDLLMELDDTDGDPIEELINAWVKAGTVHGDSDDDEGLTTGN